MNTRKQNWSAVGLVVLLIALYAIGLWAAGDGTVLTDDASRTHYKETEFNFSRETTTDNFAVALDPGRKYALYEINIHHTSATATGTLTIQRDSSAGAQHDTVYQTETFTATETDWVWQPTNPIVFDKDDKCSATMRGLLPFTGGGIEFKWETL